MPQAQLQLALAPAIRSLVGTVSTNIVNTTEELPGEAVPTDVEGMYRVGENEVWLVASNLPTVGRAKKVFAHEAFGHLAMEETPEFHDVLASVRNLLTMGNKTFKDAAEQVAKTQGNLDETRQAKEILAYMVENDIQNGTVGRAVAAVRTLLRKWGLLDGANYSEAEIKALLVRAARDLVSSAEAKQRALAAMPVEQQILEDPRAVEGAIMLSIREIYANQTLQDQTMEMLGELETATPERAREINQLLYQSRIAPQVSWDTIEPEALYALAYHGTGADPFQRFDINYVGTGDGAAAYGWGLNFTTHRGLADWYRRSQLRRTSWSALGPDSVVGAALGAEEGAGAIYEADVPEDEDLINWDVPLTQHSESVQAKIKAKFPELWETQWTDTHTGDPLDQAYIDNIRAGLKASEEAIDAELEGLGFAKAVPADSMTGENFYKYAGNRTAVERGLPDQSGRLDMALRDQTASEYLRDEVGIPGHTYKGQRSYLRGASVQPQNYVIYDDAAVAIADVDTRLPQAVFSRRVQGTPEIEAIRAQVMAPAMEDITIKDRVRTAVQKILSTDWLEKKQGLIDSAASIEALEKGLFGRLLDASESAYKQVLATRNLGSVMAAIMHRGIPMYQNGVFMPRTGRKGFIQIFEAITQHPDGNLLPLWELYAAAVRASRLIKEKNPDGTNKEKMFTQEQIDQALALGEQYPIFKEVHNEWQKFNSQLLDLAIKTGVINGEEAKIWRRNDYVPFYRAMEAIEYEGGQGPRTGRRNISEVDPRIRRLYGEEKPLGNVFENMVMNTAYLIDAIYRNTAMQRVVAMADMVAMEKVPMATRAIKFRAEELARALMNAGLIVGRGETETDMLNDGIRQVRAMTKEQRDHWVTLFRRVKPVGNDIVSVLINGERVYYRVLDPLLLRSIGAMGAQQWGGLVNTMRFAKRTLTTAVTIDPAFMMANFIRDTLSTSVIVKGNASKQITGAIRGLKAAWQEDDDMLALMMAGAGGGGFYDHNPTDVRKMLIRKMPRKDVDRFMNSVLTPKGMWRFWQRVGNASEQGNRIAVFRNTLDAGGSVAEAAYQARDVLNFTMSGDYAAMQFLVQTVPFLNARIQGLYRLWRGGKENPVGFAMKGLGIIAATWALLLRNLDDERYRELPEWDKDIYWHFFIGDEHFRLPKPFEVGALFGMLPERMAMLASGEDDIDITADRVRRMLADTFAFNPVPQMFKPIVEQYANRNMFTGSPIVGLMHEGLKAEAQYDPWTSETMRELGAATGLSPKRLEALVRGYTGTVGLYALMAADSVTRRAFGHPDRPTKGIHNYPVVTRFWRDPSPRTSKYANQLYEMLEEADDLYRTMNAYRQQQRIAEAQEIFTEHRGKLAVRGYLHDVVSAVRKVNQQIRLVYVSDLSPDDKKSRLDDLNRRKLDLMAKVAPFSDIF